MVFNDISMCQTENSISRQCISVCDRRKQAVQEAATICPRPLQVDLQPFDLESGVKSHVTWATSVPILVFLGLCS